METSTATRPCFKLSLDEEELGTLFVDVAARILAATSHNNTRAVEHSLRLAAVFVESLAEIQDNQK